MDAQWSHDRVEVRHIRVRDIVHHLQASHMRIHHGKYHIFCPTYCFRPLDVSALAMSGYATREERSHVLNVPIVSACNSMVVSHHDCISITNLSSILRHDFHCHIFHLLGMTIVDVHSYLYHQLCQHQIRA